jgi:ubiquitin C
MAVQVGGVGHETRRTRHPRSASTLLTRASRLQKESTLHLVLRLRGGMQIFVKTL